jgi:hypothetical protein
MVEKKDKLMEETKPEVPVVKEEYYLSEVKRTEGYMITNSQGQGLTVEEALIEVLNKLSRIEKVL